jgi:CubicO group peptidase (beta-lactamase class C family)
MPCDCAGAQTSAAIPDTPAGKQFAAFLNTFNTGKRAAIKAFIEANMEKPPNAPAFSDTLADHDFQLYGQTHGFKVRKITQSSSSVLKALVEANSTGIWMEFTIFITAQAPDYVKAITPYHIVGRGIREIRTPAEFLSPQKLTDSEIGSRVDKLMNTLVAADAFSGTVTVAREGKPLYARAFGLASRAWNAPNRVDTRFNLASITKMFTAVAVAQLVEQGQLSYDDTVGKILPDYPNQEVAQKVTVRHLLSHTSGLIGARAMVEKIPDSPKARTIAAMVQPFAKKALSFPPGQQFDYSNAGFILLGAIIEKASGQTYYRYVREHVFQPAGMTNTDFYELDTNPPNLATGFKDGPDGTRLDNIFDLGVIGSPAGGAYSTGADMVKFHTALVHHTLLKQSALETLWTGVTEEAEANSEYGFGAEIQSYDGTRIVGHGGGWAGITNRFEMYPEKGYTVVVLSNYDDDPNAIANKISEWLLQGNLQGGSKEKALSPVPPALTLTAEVSSLNVAKGNPLTITVTVKNSGGTSHAGVIDMEIKDGSGATAYQQFTMGQKVEAGQTRRYTYTWIPTAAGTYTVNIGAFGPRWKPKYRFEAGIATVTVK